MADRLHRTVRIRIHGRVQGVGYRYWTVNAADELGLAGWVRNRRDGTVEAVVSGNENAVRAMLEACAHGPSGAAVRDVELAEEETGGHDGFDIRPTV